MLDSCSTPRTRKKNRGEALGSVTILEPLLLTLFTLGIQDTFKNLGKKSSAKLKKNLIVKDLIVSNYVEDFCNIQKAEEAGQSLPPFSHEDYLVELPRLGVACGV